MISTWCDCRYATWRELELDRPREAAGKWLSPAEQRRWQILPSEPRRREWLAGRVLVKQMILQRLTKSTDRRGNCEGSPQDIEIETLHPSGRRLPPTATCRGTPLPWSLSLSHSSRGVLAVLATQQGESTGADLVEPQLLGPGFRRLWFTPRERQWSDRTQPTTTQLAALWAMKEAAYKACNRGEPFAPGLIEVWQRPGGGLGCRYRDRTLGEASLLQTWRVDRHVAALVICPRDLFQDANPTGTPPVMPLTPWRHPS